MKLNIGIKGRVLNRRQIEILLKNSNGDLKQSIELAFFEGFKLGDITEKVETKRRTLQNRLSNLGIHLFQIKVTFEMLRWSCMVDLFNKGYTGEYISKIFGYSEKAGYLRYKRKIAGVVTNKLRMSIFLRDNFKCVFCGSEEAIEVDHIIPVIKGGLTNKSNLQTLCFKCNSGKKGKIIVKDKHQINDLKGKNK